MTDRYRNLPLNPLRAFAIAAQHKTFTSAAAHMGISQVAVSRQISVLEGYLGVKLFERSARAVKLTETGRSFSQEIVSLFNDLETVLERQLSDDQSGTIQLRIYPTLAHYWLMPVLRDFAALRPDCLVRLDTTVEPLDFRGTHLDVAVQLGQGVWRDARSRKLFDEVIDVVCSPEYAGRFDGFSDPRTVKDAQILHAKYRRNEWESWARAAKLDLPNNAGNVFDSSLLAYSAAREGLGLAIGQVDILQNEIAAGKLIRPFNRPTTTGSSFYVVWPTNRSVSTRVKRFVDWLLVVCGQKTEFSARKR